MWTIVIPIAISALSLGLGLWNFFEQRKMKKHDRLESNWLRLLDHLATIRPEWRNEIDDTGPTSLAIIVGTSNNFEEPSLEIMRDRLRGHLAGERPDTPPGLYDTFRALAGLYRDVPKKKSEFFKASLTPYTSTRHVARGFIQAVEKLDGETVMFLIESGLFERFSIPITEWSLEYVRSACLKRNKS